jgi:hypothetical protein
MMQHFSSNNKGKRLNAKQMESEMASIVETAENSETQSYFKQPINNGKERVKDVVSAIFNNTNLHQKTVLKPRQVVQVARALVFAERYDSEILTGLIEHLCELKISDKDGRGRHDMVTALQAFLVNANAEDQGADSLRRRLLGS